MFSNTSTYTMAAYMYIILRGKILSCNCLICTTLCTRNQGLFSPIYFMRKMN